MSVVEQTRVTVERMRRQFRFRPVSTNKLGDHSESTDHLSAIAPLRYELRATALHLAVLVACCLVAFHYNRASLLLGYDGTFYRTTIKLQHEWMSVRPSLSSNPFQALGDIFFCVQTQLSPGYLIAALLGDGEVNPTVVYTIMAVEIFLATLLLCRLLHVSAPTGLGAAWLMTLLSLPFTPTSLLYCISCLCPHMLELIAVVSITIGLFWRVSRQDKASFVAATCTALFLLVWSIAWAPALTILFLPVLGVVASALLLTGPPSDRRRRIGALAVISVILSPTVGPYVLGNVLYSVPTFFTSELQNDRMSLHFASILFHDRTTGCFGPYLVVGALCGAIWSVLRGPGAMRSVALGTIAAGSGLIGTGYAVTRYFPSYVGPSLMYFEICLWPFYCLFLSAFVCGTSHILFGRWVGALQFTRKFAVVLLLLPIGCMIWSALSENELAGGSPIEYPPRSTALVDILSDEVGLTPGKAFRGSVATFAGFQTKGQKITALELAINDGSDLAKAGYDHRAMGLWYFGIPTLYQYNQFMSPSYYAAISRMLCEPTVKQVRSVVAITKPDFRYLQSLGVRYLITDFANPDGNSGRSGALSPKPGLVRTFEATELSRTLHLYELEDVNLGGYSPTKLHFASTARETVELMKRPDFDFHSEAVVAETFAEPLVGAQEAGLQMHAGYIEIEAISSGTSVLLLPIQFSHCLEVKVADDSIATRPRLVRMNLMQTGLVFSGSLKARLQYSSGPFSRPYGRIHDYLDMRALDLSALCAPAAVDTKSSP